MIAKIEFSIYYDFCEYVDLVDAEYQEYTYSRAVVVLNEIVKKLIQKNKLTFLYKGKRVDIIPNIEEKDTGNIFGWGETPMWEGVGISCNIDCEPNEFDSKKLRVGKCPDEFYPKAIMW